VLSIWADGHGDSGQWEAGYAVASGGGGGCGTSFGGRQWQAAAVVGDSGSGEHVDEGRRMRCRNRSCRWWLAAGGGRRVGDRGGWG
jgi:hypothetical protein